MLFNSAKQSSVLLCIECGQSMYWQTSASEDVVFAICKCGVCVETSGPNKWLEWAWFKPSEAEEQFDIPF